MKSEDKMIVEKNIKSLLPENVWSLFWDLTQIPRPSKHEEGVRHYLRNFSQKNNFEIKEDTVGNVYIYVPATLGKEEHESIIIQNHMDMVTDVTPGYKINFFKDPLLLSYLPDEDIVKAFNTTLGADNGIGMAVALALASSPEVSHPPLELLFTVDEETGLGGAKHVDQKLLKSSKLLNFDSEDFGHIYIGCAGGVQLEMSKNLDLITHSNTKEERMEKCSGQFWTFAITNFIGGHSGIDIHRQRGNAIKYLTYLFQRLSNESDLELSFISFHSGKAHNIIPRDGVATLYLKSKDDAIESILRKYIKMCKEEWITFLPSEDHQFTIELKQEVPSPELEDQILTEESSKALLQLLTLLPHGVESYAHESDEILPNLSSNLAICKLNKGQIYLESSIRFLNAKETFKLLNLYKSISKSFNIELKIRGEYPSWKPEFSDNPLLDLISKTYEELYKQKPKVLAIHAGLECGIIKGKFDRQISAVSIGPTIKGAHSPNERVYVKSVLHFWNFAKAILNAL